MFGREAVYEPLARPGRSFLERTIGLSTSSRGTVKPFNAAHPPIRLLSKGTVVRLSLFLNSFITNMIRSLSTTPLDSIHIEVGLRCRHCLPPLAAVVRWGRRDSDWGLPVGPPMCGVAPWTDQHAWARLATATGTSTAFIAGVPLGLFVVAELLTRPGRARCLFDGIQMRWGRGRAA